MDTITQYDIKIGDTVILKSMSPTMTVELVDSTNVTCVWYNEVEGRIDERVFDVRMLKKVDSPTDDLIDPKLDFDDIPS